MPHSGWILDEEGEVVLVDQRQRPRRVGAYGVLHSGVEAIVAGEVHELAPVQLRVLEDGRLFASLGMIVPEFLADVGKLEPGVDQDAFPMTGRDQVLQIDIALFIRFVEVPRGYVQRSDTS